MSAGVDYALRFLTASLFFIPLCIVHYIFSSDIISVLSTKCIVAFVNKRQNVGLSRNVFDGTY
jgi:hypothetical protein